jgi:hypothetical protein
VSRIFPVFHVDRRLRRNESVTIARQAGRGFDIAGTGDTVLPPPGGSAVGMLGHPNQSFDNPRLPLILVAGKSHLMRLRPGTVPMANFEHRPFRTVLIPWVIALVTLFGLSALVPDHARARKFESSGELELSQPADDGTPPGRISNSQVFQVSWRQVVTGVQSSSSQLVLIEKRRGQPVFRSRKGAIRGRAPPTGLVA